MNKRHREPGSGSGWSWYALVAAAYVLGLAVVGAGLRGNAGFPLDDSWIHQVIARNLVQHHTLGFTPGVWSSGSSSTLWTLVLALNPMFLPHLSPVVYTLVLNSALLTGCGLLLWHMARLDGLQPSEALALALLPGLSGNLAWLAFTGMEHVLFMALSLLAIVIWFRHDGAAKSSLTAGLVLGALALTRPEGIVLAVLLLAAYRRCGRSAADVVRAGAVTVLFLVSSCLVNLKTSGSLMPATMRGRRFLYTGSDHMHIGRSSVKALTTETYRRILEHHFFDSNRWWVVLFVALALYGLVVLVRRLPSRTAMLCVWATVHYACYCVVLPAAGHGGRYQPFVLLLFPGLMGIGLIDLLRRVPVAPRLSVALQWSAVLLIGGLTARTLPRWQVALRDSVRQINGSPRALATWIGDHYPAGTTMAVSDIGAIGYFAPIHVIDLGGLVDPHFMDVLKSGRVPEYIDARGAQYVVLAHNPDDPQVGDMFRLLHNPAVRLVPIDTEGIDEARWANGNAYTQHGFRFQTLYRIEHVPLEEQSAAATAAATALAVSARPGSAKGR